MSHLLISIDPGISIGLASWLVKGDSVIGPGECTVCTCVGKEKEEEWALRMKLVMEQFHRAVRFLWDRHDNIAIHMVCEWPFYSSTGGAQVSAESGALIKLAVSVGCIKQYADVKGYPIKFVGVNEWKGQLSKEATRNRIAKRLGEKAIAGFSHHTIDAIGIGLYELGKF